MFSGAAHLVLGEPVGGLFPRPSLGLRSPQLPVVLWASVPSLETFLVLLMSIALAQLMFGSHVGDTLQVYVLILLGDTISHKTPDPLAFDNLSTPSSAMLPGP